MTTMNKLPKTDMQLVKTSIFIKLFSYPNLEYFSKNDYVIIFTNKSAYS